jgi:hypothetical protein
VEGNAALAISLDAAHLGAAEATRAANAHALRAELHRGRECLLHRAAERDTALELRRDVLGHELRVRLRLAHLLDVDEDLVLGERLDPRELRLALRAVSRLPFRISMPLPPLPITMPGARCRR